MTTAPLVLHAELVTERSARAVPLARARLVDTLRRWRCPPHLVDDAALLVSELLTNAVHHGEGPRVTVRTTCADGVLRCRVHDDGTGTPVPPCHAVDSLTDHGRGLNLVDALAYRWGHYLDTRRTHGHRIVWFELHSDPGNPGDTADGPNTDGPDARAHPPSMLPRRHPPTPHALRSDGGPEAEHDADLLRRVLDALRHL